MHACTKVNLRGKRVAIVGCGTIGLFAVAVARALGARKVIGVEPMESHARWRSRSAPTPWSRPTKTTETAYVHDEGITRAIRALTDGVGVDVALEMSGSNAASTTPSPRCAAAATSSSSA